MKRGIKVAVFSLTALAVLLVALSIVIKIWLTSDRVKELVLPYAEKALGRKISIEDVKINIFTGIEISKVSIQDNPEFGERAFLSADEFVLKYAFWPLFKRKLIIHRVRVIRPQILISINEQKAFNFSDILAKIKAESTESKEPEPSEQAFIPLISEVEIRDGELTFIDQSAHPASSLLLKKVNFTAEDISLTNPLTLSLSAELPGREESRLEVSGQVDPGSAAFDFQVKVDSLDLKILSAYYGQAIPMSVLSSRLDLTSRIVAVGAENKAQVEGTISLDDLKVIAPRITSTSEPIKMPALAGDYLIKADMSQHLLRVERINLMVAQIPTQINGQIANFTTPDRTVDLRLSASDVDLGKLMAAVPLALRPKALEKIAVSGRVVDLQAGLRRRGEGGEHQAQANSTAFFGQAKLSGVKLLYQPYASLSPRLDGSVRFDLRSVQIPRLVATLPGFQAILSGSVFDYLHKPAMNIKVESQIQDLARLYQAMPADLSPWLSKVELEQGGAATIVATVSGNPTELSTLHYQGEAAWQKVRIKPKEASVLKQAAGGGGSLASAKDTAGSGSRIKQSADGLCPILQLDGRTRFTEQELAIDNVNISLPKSDLSLKGKIANYRKTPIVHMDVASRQVSLDEVLASAQALTQKGEVVAEKAPQKSPSADSAGEKISASGKVHLARASYKSLALHNVDLAYSLQNDILRWQNLRAEVFGQGVIAADGMLDVDKTAYSSTVSLKSISVHELLLALAPKYAPIFSGKFTGRIDLAGEGKEKEKIQQNLNLTGNFELAEGKVQNTELGKALFSLLPVANWEELIFKTMKGKVAVEKGKIHLDSDLVREDYVLEPRGTIGLDSSLSMEIMVRISPRILQTNKMLLSQYLNLTDERGWTVIPVKAGGTLMRPALKVDLAAISRGMQEKVRKELEEMVRKEEEKVKEKLEEKLKEKLQKQFLDRLLEKGGQDKDGQGEALKEVQKEDGGSAKPRPSSVEDVLKDTLKGFLKRR
ncbi:MAG: DUF748 domain-containing protein [bacterium]|nr:DUF748 domain-containing protein [bacterium]